MVINESAYYHGKLWCAYELKDHFGVYKEELRLYMRKESQARKFTCPDCNEPLILCAGPIMEPFFKHYENTNCIMNRKEINRRNIVARRMLYHLAKGSYECAEIEVNKKLKDKVVPDIYIKTVSATIVFEYLSYEIKLATWEEKHQYYRENGIIDVWFLNYKHYQYETKTTFEYMVSRTTKVLKFIDYEEGTIILKENCIDWHGRDKMVTKSFPIEEIRIDEEGNPVCDYLQYRNELLAMIEYEEKLEQLRIRENAVKRNFLSDDEKKEERMKLSEASQVIEDREDLWQIRNGDQKRYLFLKKLNQELQGRSLEEQREKIEEAIDVLETKLSATSW